MDEEQPDDDIRDLLHVALLGPIGAGRQLGGV
jgi:hypothetical protein